MHIQLTKKMIDWIKPKLEDIDPRDITTFSANYFNANRKKTLVVMHNDTRMGFVFYGIKKEDFKYIEQWLPWSIKTTLEQEGFPQILVNIYYELLIQSSFTFGRTTDKQQVARLSKTCMDCEHFAWYEGIAFNDADQFHLNRALNNTLVGGKGIKSYYVPKERMLELLELLDD